MNEEKYELLYDGLNFQEKVFNLLSSANEKIILHVYIFEYDSFGKKAYSILLERAKQGVCVEIVLDFFGSYSFYKIYKGLEKHKNLRLRFFNTLKIPSILQFGRRIHHKVIIVDNKEAIIGGINIIDGIQKSGEPRFDFAILLESPQISFIADYCNQIYQKLSRPRVKSKLKKAQEFFTEGSLNSSIIVNDWVEGRKQITNSYNQLIDRAEKEILLIHGYFFPSFRTIFKLKKKAEKGIQVKLIFPRYSDWQGWVWATEFLYPLMLTSGIQVYEWTLSHLHGKLGVFDRKLMNLGSHNLNYTSSFGNLEMNVLIQDSGFVEKTTKELEYKIDHGAELVTSQSYDQYSFFKKVLFFCCFLILNIIARISVIWIVSVKLIRKVG